jgi:AcrR family transcriptional regulator
MPRVVKKADVRRNEILGAAYRLFVRDGYEGTTVSALLEELGISKGAFYHHFASKDEVMEALARRVAEEMRARIEPSLARPGLSAVDRLNVLFARGASLKREQIPLLRAMAGFYYREENARLRARMLAESIDVMGPLFARLLDEGVREGAFRIEDAVETARLIIHMGTFVHDAFGEAWQRARHDLPGAAAQYRQRVEAYARAVERILGIDDRALCLIDDSTIELFLSRERE